MTSLHKFLKLKAGIRSSSCTVEGQNRFKRPFQNSNLENGKFAETVSWNAGAPSSLPSFVNLLLLSVSSWRSAHSAVNFASNLWGRTGLSASEAISRVISTPSVHGQFLSSSQLLIDGIDSSKLRDVSDRGLPGLSEKLRITERNSRAALMGVSLIGKGAPTEERKVANYALSSSQQLWRERRWGDVPLEIRLTVAQPLVSADCRFVSEGGQDQIRVREKGLLDKCSSEANNKQLFGNGSEAVSGAEKPKHWLSKKLTEQPVLGIVIGLHSLMNRSIPKHFLSGGPTLQVHSAQQCIRQLHDAGLAGSGLDRSIDNDEESVRHSEQKASDNKSLRLLSGVCCLPHPKKLETGGEDAYFICSDEQVLGVADGVGGWVTDGVDAGEYARELMSQSIAAVHEEPKGCIDPARVMQKAHSMTKCRGSSTACILALSEMGLQAANLGDSGFLVLRDNHVLFKSTPQQHKFNIPFQLESGGSDPPSAAEVFSLQVAAGDIIVAGTDGLFDNLYVNELTGLVVGGVRAGWGPQVTAQNIAAFAQSRAKDRDIHTPFSTAALDAGFTFHGGKLDDITVIVSYVVTEKTGHNSSQI